MDLSLIGTVLSLVIGIVVLSLLSRISYHCARAADALERAYPSR